MSSSSINTKNNVERFTEGETKLLRLTFPAGTSTVNFTYPPSERIDQIKSLSIKSYVIVIAPNVTNDLPASLDLISYPSIFKSNLLYESNVPTDDAIPINLHFPTITPKGNVRFSYEYDECTGYRASKVPDGSWRSFPTNVRFTLVSSVFTPLVPPVQGLPGSLPGNGKEIPVAEESTIIIEIQTHKHKLEDHTNPLYSIPRSYYL